jgi:hypothetical protein
MGAKGKSGASGSPVSPHQYSDTYDHCDAAIDRPSNLASHETAWQHIYSLQEPNAAKQYQQDTHDVQRNSHLLSSNHGNESFHKQSSDCGTSIGRCH